MTVRAPAKINLELRVGGPRRDGFHELATVFHAVSLWDELEAEPADALELVVEGPAASGVPTGRRNLVLRAGELLAERTGTEAGARIRLHKQIPVAGGMAGGSADAAAALVACDALWQTGLTRAELAEVAAELGSDVPFALLGGTAIGVGRGERLTPALARGEYHWVIVESAAGLSTPAVYAETDRLRRGRVLPEPRVSDALMQALRRGEPAAIADALGNDLQPAALALLPELERTLELGRRAGALAGLVSGSGPSVVFATRGHEHALDVAAALGETGELHTVHRAHGPVPGARLVEAVRA